MARDDRRLQAVPPIGELERQATVFQPPPPPRTTHSTMFMSVDLDMSALINDERVVTGYQMQIKDPADRHIYTLPFDQKFLDALKQFINEVPLIGEKVPDGEGEPLSG